MSARVDERLEVAHRTASCHDDVRHTTTRDHDDDLDAPIVATTIRPRSSRNGPTRPSSRPPSSELRKLPPLVFAGEARTLEASAWPGRREAKLSCSRPAIAPRRSGTSRADAIRDKLKVILQMAVVLTYAAGLPVVKVGRIAGQFAKPRSSPNESVERLELPSFRGHAVNDVAFDPKSRGEPTRSGWSRRITSRPQRST